MPNAIDIRSIPQVQNLTSEEMEVLMGILQSSKASGNLDALENLWTVDYEEIPVSIDTFLEDDYYMGKVFNNGSLIYPFWRNFLHDLFHNNPDKRFEVAISGAIGTGKSTVSAIGLMYLLYRTMCLKNPQKFYGLTANSPIVFVVLNLTLDLAYSGLYSMIVEAIKLSPWFCERVDIRGKYEFSIEFPNNIALMVGSNVQHTIGKNVLGCLTGDTEVLTTEGIRKLKDLEGIETTFFTLSKEGNIETTVLSLTCETKKTSTLLEIELENGKVIKCTPDHRFLLKSGLYKSAEELTLDDELMEVSYDRDILY